MKIAILTLCVGADYKKAMEPGLESKRAYAKKHGYDLLVGGEDVWDRTRPIPWSKVRFIQKYLDAYDFLFWSDADVVILGYEPLEALAIARLRDDKDLLWTYDVCDHYNSGNMLIRGKSAWVRDYFKRVYEQTDLIHHIWWENAAMIRLYEMVPSDAAKIQTMKEFWLFNAYVFGLGKEKERLYEPGDFLIHFAGVYHEWNIYRMMRYALLCVANKKPLDRKLLEAWRANPPLTRQGAEESLTLVDV